jgi:protein-disulfide isomerase
MTMQNDQNKNKRQKLYFVYFLAIAIIILLVFTYKIIDNFWLYTSKVKSIEKFYSNLFEQSKPPSPKITKNDPVKGLASAAITITEFSNFNCPQCAEIQSQLQLLEKFYGQQIRFVFKGSPITINPETRPALLAAYCAWEQNKFWEYKSLLYQNQSLLSKTLYIEQAQLLGLNMDQFNYCLTNRQYEPVLENNLEEGKTLQITTVPTLFINDQKIENNFNFYNSRDIIDEIINKKNAK